jgi:MFS family permease
MVTLGPSGHQGAGAHAGVPRLPQLRGRPAVRRFGWPVACRAMAGQDSSDALLTETEGLNSDQEAPPTSGGTRTTVVCGAALITAASLLLPWARAGLSGTPVVYRGTSLPGLMVPVLAGATITLVAALAARFGRRPEALSIAALSAGVTAAAAAVLIVALETAATLIPSGLVPTTMRRLTVGVSAEVGLWVALAAALVATAAASGMHVPAALSVVHDQPGSQRSKTLRLPLVGSRAVGLLGVVLAIVATVWLRYEYWINASASQEHIGLAGWAIPWVGPLTLFATLILVAGLSTVLLGRSQAGALLVAAAGWLVSFLAALVILISEAFAELRINDLAPKQFRQYGPTFQPGWAAWAAFLAGLVAAAAAAAIIMSADTENTHA